MALDSAFDSGTLAIGVAWFAVFLFSTTLHEAGHAFAALRLGDPTAYHGGQVTLNPLPHVRREPFGMVVVPLLSFFLSGWMFGWASAPYDPAWAHRYPKRAALMALAGPLANLMLVGIAALVVRIGLATGLWSAPRAIGFAHLVDVDGGASMAGLATFVSVAFSLNLILFVFNLLPLPPMDGSSVVQLAMNDDLARSFQQMLRQPMIGWMGILIAWRLFGDIFGPVQRFAVSLLYPELVYR